MSAKAVERARKEAGAKIRAAFERESVHLRVGSWDGLEGCDIKVVGLVSQLHGTVCTCCPRKAA